MCRTESRMALCVKTKEEFFMMCILLTDYMFLASDHVRGLGGMHLRLLSPYTEFGMGLR